MTTASADDLTISPLSLAVFDNVRSNVPHMLLDDVFTAKEEIATSVKEELVRLTYACGVSAWAVVWHHPGLFLQLLLLFF
jgi:regulator of protease activity HflC (stomatin/prohibitin superfamily)